MSVVEENIVKRSRGRPRKIIKNDENVNNETGNGTGANAVVSADARVGDGAGVENDIETQQCKDKDADKDNTIIIPRKQRGRHKKTVTVNPVKPRIFLSYIISFKIVQSDIDSYISKKTHKNVTNYDTILNDLNVQYNDTLKAKISIPQIYKNCYILTTQENVPKNLFNKTQTFLDFDNLQTNESSCKYETIITAILNIPEICVQNNIGPWKNNSNYACWNCAVFFTGSPIGIPTKYDKKYFTCHGNFCSFGCVARYIYDMNNHSNYQSLYSLLCLMYQKTYNIDEVVSIKMVKHKSELKIYGGNLSYNEYHNNIEKNITNSNNVLPAVTYNFVNNDNASNNSNNYTNRKPLLISEEVLDNAEKNVRNMLDKYNKSINNNIKQNIRKQQK